MLKRTLSVLIAFLLSVSTASVFAEDIQPESETAPKTASKTTYTLTLAQAIEMACKDNPQLECCDVNKTNTEKLLKAAKIANKKYKNTPVPLSSGFDLAFIKKGYYVKLYESNLLLADDNRTKTESTIAYNTTSLYYTYKNALDLLEIANNNLSRAYDILSLTDKRLQVGLATQLEVRNAQISVEDGEATVEYTKNVCELGKQSLKDALNIEEDCDFVLTDKLNMIDFDADVEADVTAALSNRYDVNSLKNAAELSELYFETAQALDDDSTIYSGAYTSMVQSEYNYTTGIKSIALSVKKGYYDTLKAKNDAQMAAKKLQFQKDEYEIYKVKYENGMITNLDLTAQLDSLMVSENSYQNTLLQYKLAVEKYGYDVKIGL